jgi:hypothetical protein
MESIAFLHSPGEVSKCRDNWAHFNLFAFLEGHTQEPAFSHVHQVILRHTKVGGSLFFIYSPNKSSAMVAGLKINLRSNILKSHQMELMARPAGTYLKILLCCSYLWFPVLL